jgi:hypothetical protein
MDGTAGTWYEDLIAAAVLFIASGVIVLLSSSAGEAVFRKYSESANPRPGPMPWWNPRPTRRLMVLIIRSLALYGALVALWLTYSAISKFTGFG